MTTQNLDEQELRRLNAEEIDAFLNNDPKTMARIWSDDLVITSPQNKFLDKKR